MRTAIFAALAGSFLATSALAQDTTPEQTLTPIAVEFGMDGLSGPGAAPLLTELERAQFVSIGEDHGFADAPALVAAFAAEGAQHGFDNYAIEVGPYSSQWLTAVLSEGGVDALGETLVGRTLAIPFLGMREEAEVAAAFLARGNLWGFDQEFIASPLIHFAELEEGASDEARALLAELLATEREAFASGNQGAVFFMAGKPEQWAALRNAFAEDRAKLARLDAMERSANIYRYFIQGRGLDNNLDRVDVIRESFLAAYHEAEARDGKPPKVILKAGSTHAGRSTSPMATFDVGSLVEGMAAANGMEALHVAYLPIGGEQIAVFPSPDGFYTVKQVKADTLRAMLEQAGVDLSPIDTGEGHFLIAMEPVKRALRNKGLQALDPMTRFTVLGYDYLITTAKGRAATPLAER